LGGIGVLEIVFETRAGAIPVFVVEDVELFALGHE
jgi:hypothetical protein